MFSKKTKKSNKNYYKLEQKIKVKIVQRNKNYNIYFPKRFPSTG